MRSPRRLLSRGKELSIKLNYGSLYAVVESLRKRSLVTALATSREGRRPERTVYEITDAGRLEHEDWLAQLLSTPEREFTSLEAGLSLMPGLPPSEVARLLGERADRLRMELRSVDSMLAVATEPGVPDLFLVESRYRRSCRLDRARRPGCAPRPSRAGREVLGADARTTR